MFLKLFKRDEILGFSYEENDSKWSLFIHLSRGTIEVNGNTQHKLSNTVYASPVVETV